MTENNHAPRALEIAEIFEDYRLTPLIDCPVLAGMAGVGRILVKVEGERPLGNFKVLGGMVAGLRALKRAAGVQSLGALAGRDLPRLICASDGNHGLSVAAAAQRAGTAATIYLPVGVSTVRAARIEALGGMVRWVSGSYDDAVDDAAAAAARGEGLLIPDTTSDPEDAVVRDVMTGYALMTDEIVAQLAGARPSHVFVQAGVGGLAAAVADGLAPHMRAPGRLLVVEPENAACVAHALALGRPDRIKGSHETAAEMLACGLASAPALAVLLRHGAASVVVREEELHAAVATLRGTGGPDTTPSGAAGLAGLLHVAAQPGLRDVHRLGADSCVLLIATERALAAD